MGQNNDQSTYEIIGRHILHSGQALTFFYRQSTRRVIVNDPSDTVHVLIRFSRTQ